MLVRPQWQWKAVRIVWLEGAERKCDNNLFGYLVCISGSGMLKCFSVIWVLCVYLMVGVGVYLIMIAIGHSVWAPCGWCREAPGVGCPAAVLVGVTWTMFLARRQDALVVLLKCPLLV